MLKNKSLETEIEIMQDHLSELRKLAGWSADELGQKLGMTRQAISALENKKTKMNQLHYLALISLFNMECENTDNSSLATVLDILFNKTNQYLENKIELDSKIAEIASIGTGLAAGTSAIVLSAILGPLGIVPAVGLGLGAAMLKFWGIGKKSNK